MLSELAKSAPDRSVIEWMDAQDSSELVITALTAAEVRAGVALFRQGRRRAEVEARMEPIITDTFAGYVLSFDVESSVAYAEVLAACTRGGRPISVFDAQIAAGCRQYRAVLATRNTSAFTGTDISLVNPWDPPRF